MSRRGALAAALAAVLAAGGCGDSGAAPAPPVQPRPPETIDHLPGLPKRWSRFVDRPGGFAIGRPRAWKARRHRHALVVRSPDRLVAITITADRSAAALAIEPRRFASRAIAALPGFANRLRTGRPHPFETRYHAVQVRGRGENRARGVRERLTVIVLRRQRLATFTAVIAANARRTASPTAARAAHVVRTLRGRPPAHPVSGPCVRPTDADRVDCNRSKELFHG